jgi:hypothetical protein
MDAINFIIDHWNGIAAIVIFVVIVLHCAFNGTNTNAGEYPKNRR